MIINHPFLSLIFPAYNESARIGKTLDKAINYLNGCSYRYEIIVVDDGSTDQTVELVKKTKKQHPLIQILENGINRGKGYSVKRGVLQAQGDYVLFSDADLSTPIEEIKKLLGCLDEGYDIAIGSRGLAESRIRIHQPWYRELMGKIFNLFVKLVAIRGIQDTQCGFKAFKSGAAKNIFPRQLCDGFGFDVEILWIAQKLGYRIKEEPIVWDNEIHSRVHPIIHAGQMLADLLRLRLNDWRGEYAAKLDSSGIK